MAVGAVCCELVSDFPLSGKNTGIFSLFGPISGRFWVLRLLNQRVSPSLLIAEREITGNYQGNLSFSPSNR